MRKILARIFGKRKMETAPAPYQQTRRPAIRLRFSHYETAINDFGLQVLEPVYQVVS